MESLIGARNDGLQVCKSLEESGPLGVHERAVADFAAGAGALTVVVQMRSRNAERGLARGQAPEEVQHGCMAARARVAERPAEDGTQMVLELARLRAFDRPVA